MVQPCGVSMCSPPACAWPHARRQAHAWILDRTNKGVWSEGSWSALLATASHPANPPIFTSSTLQHH
jgi:hypothetical protein